MMLYNRQTIKWKRGEQSKRIHITYVLYTSEYCVTRHSNIKTEDDDDTDEDKVIEETTLYTCRRFTEV